MSILISDALSLGYTQLSKITTNYKNETFWILKNTLNIDSTSLLLNKSKSINNSKYNLFLKHINKRCNRVPLQRILKKVSFYGRDFNLTNDVFIPRPETELCIDILKQSHYNNNDILEIGSGLGCISITLELEKLSNHILSIDIDNKAIILAKENAKKWMCQNIKFTKNNIFQMKHTKKYDLIISNPPYIPMHQINSLDIEVQQHDPISALTDYKDGLSFYRYLSEFGHTILNKNGTMLLEFGGKNQLNDIQNIFAHPHYNNTVFDDLNKDPRFIFIKLCK